MHISPHIPVPMASLAVDVMKGGWLATVEGGVSVETRRNKVSLILCTRTLVTVICSSIMSQQTYIATFCEHKTNTLL